MTQIYKHMITKMNTSQIVSVTGGISDFCVHVFLSICLCTLKVFLIFFVANIYGLTFHRDFADSIGKSIFLISGFLTF